MQQGLREINIPVVTELGPRGRRVARYVLIGVLAVQAALIVLVISSEYSARRSERARMAFNLNPDALWRDNIEGDPRLPGIPEG